MTHSDIQSVSQSVNNSFIYSFIQPFHSVIHFFSHFIHSLLQPFHSFIQPFTHSFNHSFIHPHVLTTRVEMSSVTVPPDPSPCADTNSVTWLPEVGCQLGIPLKHPLLSFRRVVGFSGFLLGQLSLKRTSFIQSFIETSMFTCVMTL